MGKVEVGERYEQQNILIEYISISDSVGEVGGEEEVVKNQAVISISYQVWENMSGCFGITRRKKTFF